MTKKKIKELRKLQDGLREYTGYKVDKDKWEMLSNEHRKIYKKVREFNKPLEYGGLYNYLWLHMLHNTLVDVLWRFKWLDREADWTVDYISMIQDMIDGTLEYDQTLIYAYELTLKDLRGAVSDVENFDIKKALAKYEKYKDKNEYLTAMIKKKYWIYDFKSNPDTWD